MRMGSRPVAVAIDGPAGAGKSTVAQAVASRLNYTYIDTGAMYRALALKCLQDGIDVERADLVAEAARDADIEIKADGEVLSVYLGGIDVTAKIRGQDVGRAVSKVAGVPAVRKALVAIQRRLAADGCVVMDGRDIGTVVLPEALVKVFLTASIAARADRRYLELKAKGEPVSIEDVRREIEARDRMDRTRAASPLRQADDAVLVDSTGKSKEQVIEEILEICRMRGAAPCSTD